MTLFRQYRLLLAIMGFFGLIFFGSVKSVSALGCGNTACLGPNSTSCDGRGNLCYHYEYGPSCNIVRIGNRCCEPDPRCGTPPPTIVTTPSPTIAPTTAPTATPGSSANPSATPKPDQKRQLRIVYVAAEFTDMAAFRAAVSTYKQTLLSIEPFKRRASQLTFASVENRSDLKCNRPKPPMERAIMCDQALVTKAVNDAQVPYDTIVVIVNQSQYGGAAYRGSNIAVIANDPSGPITAVHEMGHSLGNLYDEYTYGSNGDLDGQVKENCLAGTPPASAWTDLVDTADYALGCSSDNWYRSSQKSLMLELETRKFNSVSLKILNAKLDYFTNR